MASEITQTTIINRGLQLLGYKSVSGIQQNDRGARAMNLAYRPTLLSLLQENYWAFSIKRASLAESTTPPVHGPAHQYPLPNDYLMLAPIDQADAFTLAKDWVEEGGYIVSNDSSPIDIRYVSLSVTESSFHPLFAEAFSARLGFMTCEELTQSTGKLQYLSQVEERMVNLAKNRNAIVSPKGKPPLSPWISKRA